MSSAANRRQARFTLYHFDKETLIELFYIVRAFRAPYIEMSARKNTRPDKFVLAQEAIGNLLRPKLKGILSGWTEALGAHTKIESASTIAKSGVFYWHYLTLRNNLVSVLADSFRQYFKLALAHPRQTRHEPHLWAWDRLGPAVRASLEWIGDWYILKELGSI